MHTQLAAPAPFLVRPAPGRWVSLCLALLMHLLLGAVLFYGIQWQRRPPEPIEVALVREALPPPRAEPVTPLVRPEFKPAPEPEPVKADIVLNNVSKKPKPAEPEKPQSKPELKPAKTPPVKTPPENKVEKKPEKVEPKPSNTLPPGLSSRDLDQLKLESDRLSRDKVAQQKAQNQAKEDLRSEAIKRAQTEWIDLIASKVRGNLSAFIPPDVTGKPRAEVELELLPDRTVLEGSVRFVRSTGNSALDKAIERAIYKSSPFPAPPDAAAFERRLRFVFRPLDQ